MGNCFINNNVCGMVGSIIQIFYTLQKVSLSILSITERVVLKISKNNYGCIYFSFQFCRFEFHMF